MKPILRNVVLIATLWPVFLLSSVILDSVFLSVGRGATLARTRADLSSMALYDGAVGSSWIGSSAASRDARGAPFGPLASWETSCIDL